MNHLETTLAEFDSKCFCVEESLNKPATFACKYEKDEIKAFITSRYVDLEKRIAALETDRPHENEWDSAIQKALSIIRDSK